MAKGSKKDSKFDESTLNAIFYFHLWKGRMAWIKHVIPVRALDPNTGFFVEGYISAPPAIEKLDQSVEVTLAFLPIFTKNEITVKIKDIYPSIRKITRTVDKQQVEMPINTAFCPNKALPDHKVVDLFNAYPKVSFTIKEIESFLNNKMSEEIKAMLIPNGIKQCMIDGIPNNCFSGVSVLTNDNQPEKMAEKVMESLQEIYQEYNSCTRCELGQNRVARDCGEPTFGRLAMNKITSIENHTDTVMFIGEAPGMQEEKTKIAFFPEAPAGGVLDKVIKAANIDYNKCYFTNSVLCRPESTNGTTQNGKPGVDHIKTCNTRLKNEIAIVNPKIIVLLGRVAYRAFYGKDPKGVLDMLGWLNDKKTVYFAPHPSFVIRELSYASPEQKVDIKNKYLAHFTEIKARFTSQ